MTESRVFSAASIGARLLVGAAVAVGTVALVGAAIVTPWQPLTSTPLMIDARPAAADVQLACSGGMLIAGRTSVDASIIDVAAAPETIAGAPAGADSGGAGTEVTPLGMPNVQGDSGALSYREAPTDGAPAQLAAAQTSVADADDIRGLAAAACTPPLSESWLVGGATTTGWAGFVRLANPGDVAATVSLTVFTAAGASTPGADAVIVVPPRSQRALPLAGLAPAAGNPVVRVTAQGAPVTATLQSSRIRTITPSGADVAAPIALPAMRQVVPGVVVPEQVPDDEESVTTVVRVLSPGASGDAVVTVTPVGQDAPALPPISVPLEAGVPVDVDIPGLAAGSYTIAVTASAPIVTATWQATMAGAGGDYAWHAAAPAIAVPSFFAVAGGAAATLHVTNDHADPATVTVHPPSGAQLEVLVPGGGSAALTLPGAGIYGLDPGVAPVHAAVSLTLPGLNAAYPVWSAEALSDAVQVYP